MASDLSPKRLPWIRIAVVALLLALVWWLVRGFLTLDYLASKEEQLRQFQSDHPYLVFGIAFAAYAAATGLWVPGAWIMTIVYGWYFGFLPGVVLVSFASTTGATIAFLLSRYLFRDWIAGRFGERQKAFERALDREGPLYLFTLRAVPLVPFVMINAVMGVTPIRLRTYWWVTQLGMLPATIVYTYAGSTFPSLRTLAQEGVESAFTATQLTQIFAAFVAIGLFPFAARALVGWLKNRRMGSPQAD